MTVRNLRNRAAASALPSILTSRWGEDLFALSQRRNPFFLEDPDTLRFIDAGDTLTLRSGTRRADFKITDVDRNRFIPRKDLTYTIHTKYKILITYKK